MPNNSDGTPPNGTDIPEEREAVSEEHLNEIFAQWDAKRHRHEEEQQAEQDALQEQLSRIAEVKATVEATVIKRVVLLFLMMAVTATTFYFFKDDVLFFFQSDDDVIDLGDVRKRWCDAHRSENPEKNGPSPAADLQHNRIVQFENVFPTEEAKSPNGERTYFFEPMLKAVVVTQRPLPPKYSMFGGVRSGSIKTGIPGGGSQGPVNFQAIVQVPACLADLVLEKWLWSREAAYANGFSGKGRLLRAEDAPSKYKGAIKLYRSELRLDERLGDQQLWLLIDEEEPKRYTPHVIIYGVALLMIVLTFFLYFRAKKELAAIRNELTSRGVALPD